MDKPCGCPPGVCDHAMGDWQDPRWPTMGLVPPVGVMSQLNLNAKMEQGPTGVTDIHPHNMGTDQENKAGS
uniref:Uncharacterized protein n=1 Tax=Pongo abelii TaxID=9601 RepID=A0A8I5YV74_PONAB